MKFKLLRNQAKLIDDLIDVYKQSRGTPFIPPIEIKTIITQVFPRLVPESDGWHKVVFRIRSEDGDLVLKIGRKEAIENDHRVYKRLPESVRHRLFAKMYWHTKYCLLQEYGSKTQISPAEVNKLREFGYQYGLIDVKSKNIRNINGCLKIIDANMIPQKLSPIWRVIETIKSRIPEPLHVLIKKLTVKH
jgi:hypothetical protein